MMPVLRSLPYYESITTIGYNFGERAYPYQIIVWVSVTRVEEFVLPRNAPRFPAILDTGLNDNFAISPVQLRAWANLHWNQIPEEGVVRYYQNIPVPTRRAYLWLDPNQYGLRDWIDPLLPAVQIELHDGITIYGNGERVGSDPRTETLRAPRLPLLGLRALSGVGALLSIDAARRLVSLELPN